MEEREFFLLRILYLFSFPVTGQDDEPFIPPSERDDAPLAGILQDPELDKIDPR